MTVLVHPASLLLRFQAFFAFWLLPLARFLHMMCHHCKASGDGYAIQMLDLTPTNDGLRNDYQTGLLSVFHKQLLRHVGPPHRIASQLGGMDVVLATKLPKLEWCIKPNAARYHYARKFLQITPNYLLVKMHRRVPTISQSDGI